MSLFTIRTKRLVSEGFTKGEARAFASKGRAKDGSIRPPIPLGHPAFKNVRKSRRQQLKGLKGAIRRSKIRELRDLQDDPWQMIRDELSRLTDLGAYVPVTGQARRGRRRPSKIDRGNIQEQKRKARERKRRLPPPIGKVEFNETTGRFEVVFFDV
tara:strand:+ start:2630 stop:3097 length:468 start_codon:yes stop_codon:yes gene_type:complete